jgi:c-di-AMP phosphodiesterase-like protein
MNRQSTKKALLIPFVIMIITAIVLMMLTIIITTRTIDAINAIRLLKINHTPIKTIAVMMIIVSIVLFRQALMKMDSYVDGLSAQISTTNNKVYRFRNDVCFHMICHKLVNPFDVIIFI